MSLGGFVRVWAQREQGATGAARFARYAGVATVQDEPVVSSEQVVFGYAAHQLLLALVDVVRCSEPEAVGDAEDVRVDGDYWLLVERVQDDVGGFAADSR